MRCLQVDMGFVSCLFIYVSQCLLVVLSMHSGRRLPLTRKLSRVRTIHKKWTSLVSDFTLPGPADSVPGPVLMNGNEIWCVSCS